MQSRTTFTALGSDFVVDAGYEYIKEIGQGAYSCVVAVRHTSSGQECAIKKLTKINNKRVLTRQCLREIKLLRHFRGHTNIIFLYDMDIVFRSNGDFEEVYLYEELMEADLHAIIRSGQPLTDDHFQSFVYQTFCGLKYIHSANVLHRDIRPGNLLVNADCELRICDFGLARGYIPGGKVGKQGPMTGYEALRWYRAPETLFSFTNYTPAIDVWSVGCVLAELLGGRPPFKGRDYSDQLNQIIHYIGTPSEDTLSQIASPLAQEYIRSLPVTSPIPFATLFPDANPLAIDLISQILCFDPAQRISCEQALNHPYFQVWHDPADEPECKVKFDSSFEEEDSMSVMKKLIFEEVNTFRKEVRAEAKAAGEIHKEDSPPTPPRDEASNTPGGDHGGTSEVKSGNTVPVHGLIPALDNPSMQSEIVDTKPSVTTNTNHDNAMPRGVDTAISHLQPSCPSMANPQESVSHIQHPSLDPGTARAVHDSSIQVEYHRALRELNAHRRNSHQDSKTSRAVEESLLSRIDEIESNHTLELSRLRAEIDSLRGDVQRPYRNTFNPLPPEPEPLPLDRFPAFARPGGAAGLSGPLLSAVPFPAPSPRTQANSTATITNSYPPVTPYGGTAHTQYVPTASIAIPRARHAEAPRGDEVGATPSVAESHAVVSGQTDTNTSLDFTASSNTLQNDLTLQLTRDGHDPVASGGFADIYRGRLQENGGSTKVAIKAIKMYSGEDSDSSKKHKRLRREIKVWLDLRHVNVLPLLGTTMGFGRFPAMVCPWAENGTLTTHLEDNHDSLSVAEILGLLNNVASGLQYLHSCSVVHGDLSGSNVLICENGRACIADFGLSMLLTELGASTFVTSFHARGTLRWTAPELLDLEIPEDSIEEESPRSGPTTQSDVYSFGSIMLQILSGKVPYHYYVREVQVIHAVSRGMAPRRPSSALVTESRWSFIESCWSKTMVAGTRSRPSSEKIVAFTTEELAAAGIL